MYNETLHDLRVKYDQTFVGVELPSGKVLPFWISEIFCDRNNLDDEDIDPEDSENVPAEVCMFSGTLYQNTENFKNTWPSQFGLDDLVTDFPQLGAFDIKHRAVYASRQANIPSPQKYRKTPTLESVVVTEPSIMEMIHLKMSTDMTSTLAEVLYKAWNDPEYISIEESIALMEAGERLSCAISPFYTLAVHPTKDSFVISREGYAIGEYLIPEKEARFYNITLTVHAEELAELGMYPNTSEYLIPSVSQPSKWYKNEPSELLDAFVTQMEVATNAPTLAPVHFDDPDPFVNFSLEFNV